MVSECFFPNIRTLSLTPASPHLLFVGQPRIPFRPPCVDFGHVADGPLLRVEALLEFSQGILDVLVADDW
jgi:hypothetical protein